MATTTNTASHRLGCLCADCINIGYDTYNTAMDNLKITQSQAHILGQLGPYPSVSSQQQTTKVDRLVAQQYKAYTRTPAISFGLQALDGEAKIETFVVGKVPAHVHISDEVCYLDFEDLPPKMQEKAALLQAAISGDENKMIKLDGIGSVRRVAEVLLYFRVFV